MKAPSTPDLLSRFAALVGPGHALTEAADKARYLMEWRDLYRGETPLVLRPANTAEVAAILRLAHETKTAIVPQGGNTGLVGGQIPVPGRQEIVVSLERLDRVRSIDPLGNSMVVEAGMPLAAVHAAAEAADRVFPLTLASLGSCQIGGNIATNAGGTAVLAYGNARNLVLGLEVVLADGRVWNGLRRLGKDNAGYDLKQLFIGSEGTLGIVTAAALRLRHRPRGLAAAFVSVASPAAALDLFARAEATASFGLTGFELMSGLAMEFALRHLPGARLPAAAAPWYVLVEVGSGRSDAEAGAVILDILESAMAAGEALDAAVAQSLSQVDDFWRLRHGMSEVQKHEGGSIKHDVSVPIGDLPAFLDEAMAAVTAAFPGCRPVPFGHMGDGNIHFNVSQPEGGDRQAFLSRWDEMNAVVHDVVRKYDGSVAAEHGVGRLKVDLLAEVKPSLDLELMGRLKDALDPEGILNPGRVIRRS
ncbi:Oxidoreductase, FAD-binding protein [uncultured Pleomorphomonas sp.]|uniref:Oxidoreductase, FAD-binding protein n=1 Tax=uncultured Pleomorphomonas sp. TaxID=442121 RepID=A0A212LEE9_9HYPH|nr:FAD-binding oxidoreductase [uncultured Pleomorphomonas sp.]SCM75749.1 Oxidoreductase, FAD-binding protein [uncultured Pleomorphomonas sp.]